MMRVFRSSFGPSRAMQSAVRALGVDSADVSPVVDIGSDSPPPSQAELQGMQAGRHPDLSLEKAEVICCIGQLHSFDTTALTVHAVGAAHIVSARLAAWGYPDGVASASLEGKVTALDDAYHGLLGVLTPAITRLLAVEFLIMRRLVQMNSDCSSARKKSRTSPA